FTEMAFFRAQHQPLTVHINAAALKHHVVRLAIAFDYRRKLLELQFFPDTLRKLIVMLPVGILGPGVKAPVGKRNSLLVPDEDWAGVARPDSVGGPDVKLHALRVDIA